MIFFGDKTVYSVVFEKFLILVTSVAKRACSLSSSFAVSSAADDVCVFFNASSNSALTLLNMSRKLLVCDSASLASFALVAFRSWFRAWRVVTRDLYCVTSCSAVWSLLSVVRLNSSLVYGGKGKVVLFTTRLFIIQCTFTTLTSQQYNTLCSYIAIWSCLRERQNPILYQNTCKILFSKQMPYFIRLNML